ncbi:MAG: DUF1446 domain-containing protein, partial [candidate division Zixibacteria bacterium]
SMSYNDGWKASGGILISGPDTYKKARVAAAAFWKRLGLKYEQTRTDMIGSGSIWPKSIGSPETNEIILQFGVRDQNRNKITEFGKLLSSLILSGPSGMAVISGRPRPSQVVAYWPALMKRENASCEVLTLDTDGKQNCFSISFTSNTKSSKSPAPLIKKGRGKKATGRLKAGILQDFCYARSGDKGDTCNIGVLARSPQIYAWLVGFLTAAKVKSFFKGITLGKVRRFELDNLEGLNFLLEESLGGGGTRSLMVDPQGKTLAQALLQMPIKAPSSLWSKTRKAKR